MPRHRKVDSDYFESEGIVYLDTLYDDGEVKTKKLGRAETVRENLFKKTGNWYTFSKVSPFGDFEADDEDYGMEPCCVACGNGAYPDCKASCSLFDD